MRSHTHFHLLLVLTPSCAAAAAAAAQAQAPGRKLSGGLLAGEGRYNLRFEFKIETICTIEDYGATDSSLDSNCRNLWSTSKESKVCSRF
eukprot:1147618-Pelagomonas_calceolata.AAC.2